MNQLKKILISDNLNAENYGSLPEEILSEEPFILCVASPFITEAELQWKMNCYSYIRHQCKAIVGQHFLPYTNEIAPICRFALHNNYKFRTVKLPQAVMQHYKLYKGCICVNLAKPDEDEKLMIVYIPEETQKLGKLDLSCDPLIIGLSSNTVQLSQDIEELTVTGKLYGDRKNQQLFKEFRYDGRNIYYKRRKYI